MSESPKVVEAPLHYTPPSQLNPSDLMKALQDDGIVPTEEVAKPAEPEQAQAAPEETKAPAPPKEEVTRLVQIAREKAAKRQELEQSKPQVEALKVFSPQELNMLAAAKASGNPRAALRAIGFSHEDYNKSVVSEGEPPAPVEKTGNSDVDALRQEIQALRQEREAEKMQSTRAQVFEVMKDALADDRFSDIESLEDLQGVEQVLTRFHQETGELPGSTFNESVVLAAEEYLRQQKLAKEAREKNKWRKKALTPPTSSVPMASGAPAKPPAGTDSPRTLTNANTTAPAAPRSVSKTREEILAAIIEGRDEDLPT